MVWLLRARGQPVAVPFVQLWRGEALPAPVQRRRRLPPAHLLLFLLVLLLLIGAAIGPVWHNPLHTMPQAVLLIDRGLIMSARSDGRSLVARMAHDLQADLVQRLGVVQPLSAIVIPGDSARLTDTSDYAALTASLTTTALDTRALIEAAAQEALRDPDQLVIVLSPHALAIDDPRLIQVTPPRAPVNVGIEHAAYREHPSPQVMVKVLNQSPLTAAQLHVGAGQSQPIDLPPAGQSRTYFIDLPTMPAGRLHVRLEVEDEISLDNDAWLVRRQGAPRVQVSAGVPSAVRRIADIYAKLRPAAGQSPYVLIRPGHESSPLAGVIVATTFPLTTNAGAPLAVVPHPITVNLDWSTLLPGELPIAKLPDPPGDWETLASMGDQPILAIRRDGTRQAWIGFDLTPLAARPGFVILWTNLLDWAGGDEQASAIWRAEPPHTLAAGWQRIAPADLPADVQPGWLPGLYQNDAGRLMAIHAPAQLIPDPPQTAWREKLSRHAADARIGRPLAPILLMLALILLAVAAFAWPARRR